MGIKGPPPTLLLVDDQPENLGVFKALLIPLGCAILEAGNGKEGLEQALAHHPDLIITDIRMPEMDGLELIRRIRAVETRNSKLETPNSRHPAAGDQYQPVIIATSAGVYREDRQRCFEAGSQAFLPKPIDADLLFQQLQQLLAVDWVYQDEPTEPGESPPLILPSEDELDAMMQAALNGDIGALQAQLEGYDEHQPQLRGFVATLRPMVQGFRISDMQDFLHACLPQTHAEQAQPDS